MNWEPDAAAAVIGLAGFQILQAWNANAPSLQECRSADADDISTKQKLVDADFLVGGLAVILGTTFAVMTKDYTALIVMVAIFGTTSLWYHSVMNAESR